MANVKKLEEYLKGVCPLYEGLDESDLREFEKAGAMPYTNFVCNDGYKWYFECQECGEIHEKLMPEEADFVYIGSSPTDDNRFDNYVSAVTCSGMLLQLKNTFGDEPEGARLCIKQESGYREVVCCYDLKYPMSYAYAMMLESSVPSKWSPAAIAHMTKLLKQL